MSHSKRIILTCLLLSFIAEAALVFIIYFNPFKITPLYSPSIQPWVNAFFNTASAISIGIAYKYIKYKHIRMHKIFVHLALIFSTLFLINYIFYHLSVGHMIFENQSWRTLYLLLLMTHLLCSIITLPLIFISYGLGIFGRLADHKKLAKWTFLLWEYVSISGVMVVLMLKLLN